MILVYLVFIAVVLGLYRWECWQLDQKAERKGERVIKRQPARAWVETYSWGSQVVTGTNGGRKIVYRVEEDDGEG